MILDHRARSFIGPGGGPGLASASPSASNISVMSECQEDLGELINLF